MALIAEFIRNISTRSIAQIYGGERSDLMLEFSSYIGDEGRTYDPQVIRGFLHGMRETAKEEYERTIRKVIEIEQLLQDQEKRAQRRAISRRTKKHKKRKKQQIRRKKKRR